MCRFRRPVLRPETNVSHWITEKRRSDEPRGVGSCWTSHFLPVNSFSYTDVHLSEWFQKNFATTFSKWQRWRAELVFSINYFRNLLLYFFVNSLDTTTQFDEIMCFLQLNNYTDLYIILSTWKMKNTFRIRGTDWTKLI